MIKCLDDEARRLSRPSTIVLLGGREDTDRNQTIATLARSQGLAVLESSTEDGLRSGMVSVAACDVVVTGDSLGLHMALGFQKSVVAWFGPTCSHEIDLYGGEAVTTKASCAPCWKRACEKSVMCYDQVDFSKIAAATYSQIALLKRRSEGGCNWPSGLENTAEL